MREIRDLLLQPDQVNPLIDAVAARLAPIAPADLARWSTATPAGASYSSLATPGPGLQQGLAGYVKDLKTFLFTGGTYPWWVDRQTVPAGGWITRLDTVAADTSIPAQPTLHYVGQTNYPMNSLTFECLPFADPQGANTFAGMQWRLAEVRNTNQPAADPRLIPPLEWDALWTSGILTTWSNRVTIPGVYTKTNAVYRARVRHLDKTGRWSKWSAPVQFSVTAVDLTTLLREGLRLSEIMYNPPPWALQQRRSGVPGAEERRKHDARSQRAGVQRHHLYLHQRHDPRARSDGHAGPGRNRSQRQVPGLAVHGLYSGKLDNAGETIRLKTPPEPPSSRPRMKTHPLARDSGWPGLVAGAERSGRRHLSCQHRSGRLARSR